MTGAEAFDAYVGRSVGVLEEKVDFKLEGYEDLPPFVKCTLVASDPIVEAIRAQADEAGLRLRVWLPDSVGTADWKINRLADWKINRLNVHIKKNSVGYYVERFNLG